MKRPVKKGPASDLRLRLLGVGAMRSERFAPAGLLLERGPLRVMFDGGPNAEPAGPLDAWLVCDVRCELMPQLRRLAAGHGVRPAVASISAGGITIEPRSVVHTSHPTWGYLISADGQARVAWAPEFWHLPEWVAGVDLLFADGASWRRPIRFARSVGGHAAVVDTAVDAARLGVRRLVFAHLGRPTIRALDAGEQPPFGEFGWDGATYRVATSYPRSGSPHAARIRARAAR